MGELKMSDGLIEKSWSNIRVVDEGKGYKMLKLEIKPGCMTSYHYHTNRVEIIAPVSTGVLVRDRDSDTEYHQDGDVIFIEKNEWHQLINPNKNKSIELCEIWIGDNFEDIEGETIVRDDG